jgi:putative intracellular protease/amidase
MRPRSFLFLIMSLTYSTLATAQTWRPDFDPAAFKGPASGPPNQVVVLGTAHLRAMKIDPALTQLLDDRLAAWQPQAIAIEELSSVQCDFLRRYPQRYQETVESYCWDPAPARAATGLDVPAATVQWERLLAAWPAAPTAAQRRHLAAVFLAGGEKSSALVQWLRLAPADRHAGDGLDAALVAFLQTREARGDETALVSARVAARLGHERVYAMDDHTADSSDGDDAKASGAAIAKAWDNPATAQRKRTDDALAAQLKTPDDLLNLYRAYNAPGQGPLIFASDFGAAMNEPSPQHFGRMYVGYWETRNLRMASNIREALGMKPGLRMLVVVGASHKGYLEAYLHQMHDVRLVDVMPLLK